MDTFKNKILGLIGIGLAVFAIAATSFHFITGYTPRQIGAFYYSQANFDSATAQGIGGVVKIYLVGAADTERVGNIAYLSSANTVKHSATLTNYNAIAGVVVGGAATGMQASLALADTGTIAGIPGQQVLVLERGRTYVLADTQAGFSPGTQVLPSIKSGMGGRLNARLTTIDTFFRIFGKTVDTTVSGKAVLVDVRVR